MLEQTKRIIDILLDSGFDRKDFRANVQRERYGYGDVFITLLCDTEKAVKLTPRILEHNLIVEHIVSNGRVRHVSILPYGTLKDDERLQIINLDICPKCNHPIDMHTADHGWCIIPDCLCINSDTVKS